MGNVLAAVFVDAIVMVISITVALGIAAVVLISMRHLIPSKTSTGFPVRKSQQRTSA